MDVNAAKARGLISMVSTTLLIMIFPQSGEFYIYTVLAVRVRAGASGKKGSI